MLPWLMSDLTVLCPTEHRQVGSGVQCVYCLCTYTGSDVHCVYHVYTIYNTIHTQAVVTTDQCVYHVYTYTYSEHIHIVVYT